VYCCIFFFFSWKMMQAWDCPPVLAPMWVAFLNKEELALRSTKI
jgi:hypothetical protein